MMELALTSAGLQDIRWHAAQVSPEGVRQSGEEHRRGFLALPPIVFLECVKSAALIRWLSTEQRAGRAIPISAAGESIHPPPVSSAERAPRSAP
jgi:hypothetical protein